jgi:pSer/pThr/pTyr-binding forkhead associated (FHA) protein
MPQKSVPPTTILVTQPLTSDEQIFGTIRPRQYDKVLRADPNRPAVMVPKGTHLILLVENTGARLRVPVEEHLMLGRKTTTSAGPLLDLTPYGGFEHHVSRQHATLRRTEDGYMVVNDQASSCGTFLNGKRLLPLLRYVLSSGDLLQLGRLNVRVTFDPEPTPNG